MPTPLAAAVFACESVIEDKQGIFSVIRILDVAEVSIPPEVPPDKRVIQFKVLATVKFAPGEAVTGTAELRFVRPNGAPSNAGIDPIPFSVPADQTPAGFNLATAVNLVIKEEGVHHVFFVIDGKDVAHTIFTLRVKPTPKEALAESQE